jgi:hypothetical protein
MSKPLWACSICGEDFTRKSSAKRHRFNVHDEKGLVVRYTEYLVGRMSGEYPKPIEPRRLSEQYPPLSRRKNGQEQQKPFYYRGYNNEEGPTVMADRGSNLFRSGNIPAPAKDNMHRRSYLHEPLHQLIDKALHKSFDPLRIQERKSKIEEFKTLVSKYYTPENGDQILRLAFCLYSEEDDDYLDISIFNLSAVVMAKPRASSYCFIIV